MPFELRLPNVVLAAAWKVKIRDKERNEEPHVSILFKGGTVYRFGLRKQSFLDAQPDPRNVPDEVTEFVVEHLNEFIVNWDRLYPENPVSSVGDDDNE
ncbi:MAG TPA: hypothetical protein VHC69_32455 [Polyangiaceae bacterium]|nr:hypothetical protein [Polyangiaceae bacterium]